MSIPISSRTGKGQPNMLHQKGNLPLAGLPNGYITNQLSQNTRAPHPQIPQPAASTNGIHAPSSGGQRNLNPAMRPSHPNNPSASYRTPAPTGSQVMNQYNPSNYPAINNQISQQRSPLRPPVANSNQHMPTSNADGPSPNRMQYPPQPAPNLQQAPLSQPQQIHTSAANQPHQIPAGYQNNRPILAQVNQQPTYAPQQPKPINRHPLDTSAYGNRPQQPNQQQMATSTPNMASPYPQPQVNQNMYNRQQPQPQTSGTKQVNTLMGRLSVEQSDTYPVKLLEQKNIVPPTKLLPPRPPINEDMQRRNANPQTMRCTLNAIPQTSSLLKQCKLPFSIYVHPFKENMNTPVIANVITRCRSCRSYLNPFVSIPDHRRWQCNMCFRLNDLPEELSYNQQTRQYMDVRKREELTSSSIEFIAPSEYMLRPPQPSVFVFVLDVSYNALSTGYLAHCCETLKENLDNLPGDCRTKVAFITFNSSIHFYSLKSSQHQPQMHKVSDLDDIFLPVPDGLLVNIKENRDMILQLLESLPTYFDNEIDSLAATGAALLAGRKMTSSTGGRVTLFQTCLPSVGPGALKHRDASSISGTSKDLQNLNPSTDFYKRLALDCASEQIGMDIFLLTGQYCDLASLSPVSRYSSGAIHHFPDFHATKNLPMLDKFKADFKRYLTRDIGFEAVMRLRCTKGLSIHTFHGNFFVRSTDLLSLPNVNPDHSFSMQISIDENLDESNMAAFQAALLYTTTKGERRIRVHTLALPVTTKLADIYAYADQEAVALSLSKLAVDRALSSSIGDAREALMNACIDCFKVYRTDISGQRNSSAILAPYHLRLLPLLVLALMKNEAFRLGSGVALDARVFALLEYKWQPFEEAILKIYPKLYSMADICSEDDEISSAPPILNASAEKLSRTGSYLMDTGKIIYIFVGRNSAEHMIHGLFNVPNVSAVPENLSSLPELNNAASLLARNFITKLRKQRHFYTIVKVIREDSQARVLFLNKLLDDRTESSMSYQEFLQHLQRQING